MTYLGWNAPATVFIGLGKIPVVPSLVTDWSTIALCMWCVGACASHALLPKVSVADAVKNSE